MKLKEKYERSKELYDELEDQQVGHVLKETLTDEDREILRKYKSEN